MFGIPKKIRTAGDLLDFLAKINPNAEVVIEGVCSIPIVYGAPSEIEESTWEPHVHLEAAEEPPYYRIVIS